MSTFAPTLADSGTMLRRNLIHAVRYPIVLFAAGIPIVFMLLFVYVFGGTLGDGLPGGGGQAGYLGYVVPGIVMFGLASGPQLTAISVAQDMNEGIIARFRTMDISRTAVLAGHVIGNTLQQLLAVAAVFVVAVLMGYRPTASVWGWLGAWGEIVLVTYALSWLAVALGTWAKSVESASNLPMPLMLLPFLGSGFVPTDSMPQWLQWFAQWQPFTPFTETLRGFLSGAPIGANGWWMLAWVAVIGTGGWLAARALYARRSVRTS